MKACTTKGCFKRAHAKGLCSSCYARAAAQTPERKAWRKAYNEKNREAIRESWRKYNWQRRGKDYSQRVARAPQEPRLYVSAVVPVPVKGWGYRA